MSGELDEVIVSIDSLTLQVSRLVEILGSGSRPMTKARFAQEILLMTLGDEDVEDPVANAREIADIWFESFAESEKVKA